MARLTPSEFEDMVACLVEGIGLAKLQERLIRTNALVSRRRLGSVSALSRQMHQLTFGLERDGLPSQVILALWEEHLGSRTSEAISNELDEIAARVNSCLDAEGNTQSGRHDELRVTLLDYQRVLVGAVGRKAALVAMLLRAVPDVARLLRSELMDPGSEGVLTGEESSSPAGSLQNEG
jgi:hypothetical protein